MRIGFTGTRAVPLDRLQDVYDFLKVHTEGGTEFTTGACIGFDRLAAFWLLQNRPYGTHRLCVPANRKQVDPTIVDEFLQPARGVFKVIEIMPDGTDYRFRNLRIVQHSDTLNSVAEYPEVHGKSTRSGTWQTVRLARSAGVPVNQFIFNL